MKPLLVYRRADRLYLGDRLALLHLARDRWSPWLPKFFYQRRDPDGLKNPLMDLPLQVQRLEGLHRQKLRRRTPRRDPSSHL